MRLVSRALGGTAGGTRILRRSGGWRGVCKRVNMYYKQGGGLQKKVNAGHSKQSQTKQCCVLCSFHLLGVTAVDLVRQDWRVGREHRRRHRLGVQGARLVAGAPTGLRQFS